MKKYLSKSYNWLNERLELDDVVKFMILKKSFSSLYDFFDMIKSSP